MLMLRWWILVICLLLKVIETKSTVDRPRTQLEDAHNTFNARKHRKYDERRSKLKQQDLKQKNAQYRHELLNTKYSMNGTRFCYSSLPAPHSQLSIAAGAKGSKAVVMTAAENMGKGQCSYLGAICSTERTEHILVNKYLLPTDVVLETGARYGTTSCVIANKQENSGKLVSVEPDYRVWNLLDENAKAHNCHFWLLRGAVSDRPVTIDGTFYSTRSIAAPSKTHRARGWHGQDRCNDLDAHSRIPLEPPKSSYTYEELQAVTKLRFTALLIDCEGCIESLFAGNSVSLDKLLQDVNTIILEADMPVGALDCTHDCVDYAVWIAKFAAMGLAMVETVQDPVYPKIFHYVFQRKVGSA